MIWFLIGIAPFVIGLAWLTVTDWRGALFVLTVLISGAAACFSITYGMYDMGWVMECGGDTFWTAEDC